MPHNESDFGTPTAALFDEVRDIAPVDDWTVEDDDNNQYIRAGRAT